MSESLKKILFLDRDGVINYKAAEHEYITGLHCFAINERIFELLEPWKSDGYEFIVITNQRGIARGIFSEAALIEIHEEMSRRLKERGLGACQCRKPQPGLLSRACEKYPIDLAASALISDSADDVEMGRKFGVGRNILVKTDEPHIFIQ